MIVEFFVCCTTNFLPASELKFFNGRNFDFEQERFGKFEQTGFLKSTGKAQYQEREAKTVEIRITELRRPSACGEGDLFSRRWDLPEQKPKAILQIAHGMNEHCGRYDRFARLLAAQGYVVYANDHIGHGNSDFGHRGTFSLQKGGFEFLLQDMKTLYRYAEEEHPGLPRILFGHSMGSIASAVYPARDPNIDLLILMGTPAQNPLGGLGMLIAGITSTLSGRTKRSQFLIRASEADMGKCALDPMERNRWLSRDENEVRKFVGDPLRGETFSASAYGEMLAALREFGSRNWPRTIPEIPVLITAGAADSVGKCGAGPKFYYQRLLAAGHQDVTLRPYDGARHELLNETNREEVTADLLAYLDEKTEKILSRRNGK